MDILFGHKHTRSGDQIRTLLETYRKDLSNQQQKARQDIDDWCKNLIDGIKRHADEQKRRLEQEYKRHSELLDSTRKNFIQSTLVYEQSRKLDQLNDLLTECRNLQFKMTELQRPDLTVKFIEVLTPEHLNTQKTNEKHDDTDTTRTTDNKLRTNKKAGTASANSSHAQERICNGASTQPGTSENNNSDSNDLIRTNDNSEIAVCPKCLMIFPPNMLETKRYEHVEQHFAD